MKKLPKLEVIKPDVARAAYKELKDLQDVLIGHLRNIEKAPREYHMRMCMLAFFQQMCVSAGFIAGAKLGDIVKDLENKKIFLMPPDPGVVSKIIQEETGVCPASDSLLIGMPDDTERVTVRTRR